MGGDDITTSCAGGHEVDIDDVVGHSAPDGLTYCAACFEGMHPNSRRLKSLNELLAQGVRVEWIA